MSTALPYLRARLRGAASLNVWVRLLCAAALVASSLVALLVAQPRAGADTSPPAGVLPTVSADGLPTVQIDGVVWAQVVVGNTVYATGSFSHARPYGTNPGDPGEVVRSNLLAYDITTGNLITSFDHSLNAQGRSIAASPDGKTIYVGGDFTTVDGVTRNYMAAFDVATGALSSTFKPSLGNSVTAIATTATTVYAGGNFLRANGVVDSRLAAFSAGNGALLSWNASADDQVSALVVSPDGSKVVVGGKFVTLNGQTANGIGAVDASTGNSTGWSSTFPVHDYGTNSGFTSLTTDGTYVYGSGYNFHGNGGNGNFEGRFASDFSGNLVWLDSCHGDTYGTYIQNSVLYSVGHAHDCSDVGAWDDTNPRSYHRALAETLNPTGTLFHNTNSGYADFAGLPSNSLLHWYPAVSTGTYTGQTQGAWSVAGNSSYVTLGGEFLKINSKAQQGLVRFAVKAKAPNKWPPYVAASMTPTAVSLTSGAVRVRWQTTWDADNATLTYNVFRDGGTTPIFTTTATTNFWTLPWLGFTDTGLSPGSTHTYKVQVVDPSNNKINSPLSTAVTVSGTSNPLSSYGQQIVADGATSYWPMTESAAGGAAYDQAAWDDLSVTSGVTSGGAGPISGDTAMTFPGSNLGTAADATYQYAPDTFSLETWVKTNTTTGGKIIGFGDGTTAASTNDDRQIYMDNAGHLLFGVNSSQVLSTAYKSIASPATYNDNAWHHVVATYSAASGMALYVDGVRVARNQTVTTAARYMGYWHLGGDTISGWPSAPTSAYFKGSIADTAVYSAVLPVTTVQNHFAASGRSLSSPGAPGDTYGATVYADAPDLYWRLNDTSGTTAVDSSPNGAPGTYTSTGVTKGAGPAFASSTSAITLNGTSGGIASSTTFPTPVVYSLEAWFKTKSTAGGRIVGYSSSATGTSATTDRMVYVNPAGQLVFGVNAANNVKLSSSTSYNDGFWHQVTATQGPGGMALYVDGQLQASNAVTTASSFTGYWRVGSDKPFSGGGANFFAGSIDEVAVYPTELSASSVQAHYAAAGAIAQNQPPTAAFTPSCDSLTCSVDGSASADPDGVVSSYSWDWGDGTPAGSGVSSSHDYAVSGTYTITLTVTDDNGATGTKSIAVTVKERPKASFTQSCTGLSCTFDGSGSTDAVGNIVSYDWDFGDGTTGTGATPNHTYATTGNYTVKLTVTDDNSLTGSTTKTLLIGDSAPVAAFTVNCTNLTCTVDGSSSSDPDGDAIASYAWTFGDGGTGSGVTTSHTYAAAGTYSIKLTVTDPWGLTNSTTQSVSPTAPALPTPFAQDTFNRTVASGWGTADQGGAWTATSTCSVTPGAGKLVVNTAGGSANAYLGSVSQKDADITASISLDKAPTGSGSYFYVIARRPASNYEYRVVFHFLASGAVGIAFSRLAGSSTETVIKAETAVSGLTYTAGAALNVRVQATGTSPTTLRARAWLGTTEPGTWTTTVNDSTAGLQVAGGIGVRAYLTGSTTGAPYTFSVMNLIGRPTA